MGQALYRKYRSKTLAELVGQEHITTALARALKQGTFAHAYLFTGPRGTGKTSIARILAHEVNGLPYQDDANHLDIIEIDAASNRRIDEIRELRDKVHMAPASAKYKVYIIDEVHMLTKEAFNALLKTLEEPPAHVIFILATTEVHKLPETIISRTQRFAFKPVELSKVMAHLKHIAKSEHIAITDDALQLIAAHGEGSFRDSISLLDQARHTGGQEVSLADVQALLGIAPEALIQQTMTAVAAHNLTEVSAALQTMQSQGYEPAHMAKQIAASVRQRILEGQQPEYDALALLGALVQVPASRDPRATLEIALFDAALQGQPPKTTSSDAIVAIKPVVQIEPHPSSFAKKSQPTKTVQAAAPLGKPLQGGEDLTEENTAPTSDTALSQADWQTVLDTLKKQFNTLYSIVKTAKPVFTPGQVLLECQFAFHKKQLSTARNKTTLLQTIQATTGQHVDIQCKLIENPAPAAAASQLSPSDEQIHTVAPPKKETEALKTVSNIFGGAELLES